jgi:tyrosine-protein kinase Etk/Wzc
MNARNSLQPPIALTPPVSAPPEDEGGIDFVEYWDIIVDHRWFIAVVATVILAIGTAYAFLAQPTFEANLLIQVEDSAGSTKNFLGEAASLFDVKTPAAAEMEIIRSRMVVGKAVDNTLLYIDAKPHYVPIIGNWLARHSKTLSNPGILGFGGYVSGAEKISVTAFDVPQALEGTPFRLTAHANGKYALSQPQLAQPLVGTVGSPLERSTPLGTVSLTVSTIEAKPGAEFTLVRRSRLATIQELQRRLKLAEKGRQSGVIEAVLQSANPRQLTVLMNEIGRLYVRQNIERKAAEAQKQLQFLVAQLPQFKKQLEDSEESYNKFRSKQGTIDLDDEAKTILNVMVDLQSKLLDAKQRRLDLVARFTAQHPLVKTLDEQTAAWQREISSLESRIHRLPTVQQDVLRLQRDVQVNNDAYQSLRSNQLQLQLIREGKVGNARLIDEAVLPERPIWPQAAIVIPVAALLGLMMGVMLALARNALNRGIRSSQEIEAHTGLSVYSTIPLSPQQQALARLVAGRQPGVHLLALLARDDPAIESLRSLRTALQFAMLEAPNNLVLITGATPGVGKSFVSANFAAILASAGKRVLLVDADLRKGHLNNFFGVQRDRGLSELVAGTLSSSEAIRRDVVPNLDLVTTGVLPPNPAELMMSGALANVMERLSSEYDLVVVDTPPVLVAADTMGMAAHAGTLLLVARAGESQLGELHETAKRLAHVGKTASGVLFNGIDVTRRYYGSYGYKYGGYRYRQYSYATAKN